MDWLPSQYRLENPSRLYQNRAAKCVNIPERRRLTSLIGGAPFRATRPGARLGTRVYDAYPDIQGLHYGSSMNGHAPAIVLNDRAQRAIPNQPRFHRSLNDDMLVEVLQRIAPRLSYGLR
jgi:hypothetical protein